MTNEEKKAIEYLKRHIIPVYGSKGEIEYLLNDTILNLIEKQSKELESDKEIKDKMIEMYIEHIYRSCDFDNRIKTKEQIKQYFENLAKESGEIDEGR